MMLMSSVSLTPRIPRDYDNDDDDDGQFNELYSVRKLGSPPVTSIKHYVMLKITTLLSNIASKRKALKFKFITVSN